MANYLYNSILSSPSTAAMLLQLLDNTVGLTSVPVPACGYSVVGESFDACLHSSYSTTVGGWFGIAFPCRVFTQGNSRLSNIIFLQSHYFQIYPFIATTVTLCLFWVPSLQDALASIENGICAHTLFRQPYVRFLSHPASPLLFPNPQRSSQWWQ